MSQGSLFSGTKLNHIYKPPTFAVVNQILDLSFNLLAHTKPFPISQLPSPKPLAMAASDEYNGPSVNEMLQNHTLAKEIIARANGALSQRILDDKELLLLRRWSTGTSTPEQILAEENIEPCTGTNNSGSLVGLLIANSVAGKDLVTKEEVEQLREWFEHHS